MRSDPRDCISFRIEPPKIVPMLFARAKACRRAMATKRATGAHVKLSLLSERLAKCVGAVFCGVCRPGMRRI